MAILKLDGDAAGAVRATADVHKEVRKLGDEFKYAGGKADDLDRIAKRIVEDNKTPLEQHQKKLEQVARAYALGKISAEDQARAMDRLNSEFAQHGKHHEQSFGAAAISQLGNYIVGLYSVEKAIEAVTAAITQQAEEKRKAVEGVQSGLPGAGQIANVSRTRQEFQHNLDVSDKLQRLGVDENAANVAAAGMAAAQLTRPEEAAALELVRQQRVSGSDIGTFAQNIARVQQAYKGQAGTKQDLMAKLIRAGSDTLGVSTPVDIGREFADVADEAAAAKIPFDQALAAYVATAQESKSSRAAGGAVKKMIEAGEMPRGEAYAKELVRIQGAPKAGIQDYIATDPTLNAARDLHFKQSSHKETFESLTAEATALVAQVYQENRQRNFENYGAGGISAILNAYSAWTEKKTLGWNQEHQVLSDWAADPRFAELHSKELLASIRDHIARQTAVIEQQRNLVPTTGRGE